MINELNLFLNTHIKNIIVKIKIEQTKVITTITEKEIKFPYFGWWDHKKEQIVKIDYGKDIHKLNCVTIKNGWCINPSIYLETISIIDGVIEEKINYLLRDYSDTATIEEFEEFKNKTLKLLS